ncbi:MAG: (d)CMP kinase [Clostridiales bacterium]|nr:(d)CMP kinase [Clostridiales bacterium]
MIRIALDGPGGAGKSSLAKELAKRLGIVYLDTGALYRTVGLWAKMNDTDPKDADKIGELLGKLNIDVKIENGAQVVYLNGEPVGDKIRTPEMSMYASAVSALPCVREFLLETQRSFARTNSVIMDGRDIGTVILPDADVKIFLTASEEVRAKRRLLELQAKGIAATFDEVLSDMHRRDTADASRDIAPAVAAADAVILDNSDLDTEGTIEAALKIIEDAVK